MKKQINEIKRMQRIAGLITESEYRESQMDEAENGNMITQNDIDTLHAKGFDIITNKDWDFVRIQKMLFAPKADWRFLNNLLSSRNISANMDYYRGDGDKGRSKELEISKEYFDTNIKYPPLGSKLNESPLNEAEPNIKKIGKYVTVETDEDGDEYPDLDAQAISDYLKTIKDEDEVDAFMDNSKGYDESRLHFFDDENYNSIKDEEVEKWARQEMSYFQNSEPEDEELDESPLNEDQHSVSDETYGEMDNFIYTNHKDDYDNFIDSAINIINALWEKNYKVEDIFDYLNSRLEAEV